MLVSFAAALEGGISFDSQITQETSEGHSSTGSANARLGISKLFSQLFDASVAAEISASDSDATKEIRRESKSHTEASIAIVLYDHLTNSKEHIVFPTSLEDFRKLQPGALVELAGIIEKNAVDATIDYIDAVSILGSLDTTQPQKQQKEFKKEMQQIRDTLNSDRKRTPISNVLLRCTEPAEMTAAVTLRTENLRDLTLSELHKNNVHVVGKVTRVIDEGKSMTAFENYGMAMLDTKTLTDAFQKITSTEGIAVELSEVEIHGPAVQLLPLMIFV